MHLLCLQCSIFLVLVSSQISATTDAENVGNEVSISAKILTNFWKVPWMNVNSSWAGKVAPACGNDISTLFRSADDGEMWALQMLDASSKIPSGILQGNIFDLGMYDQCVKVTSRTNPANIQANQCRVSLGMPPKYITNAAAMLQIQRLSPFNPTPNTDLSFGAAVCLPSSCGIDDVANFVNASIRSNPELSQLEVRVVQVQCSSVDAGAFTPATILVLSLIAVIVTLLMFCTACDFFIKARPDRSSQTLETLAKFSLYANAIKLTSTDIPQGSLSAVHGLRSINMFFVVCVHRLLSTPSSAFVNLGDLLEFRDSTAAALSLIFPFGVDTFFVLTGFFAAHSFLRKLHSGERISILQLYFYRYLRLMPCVGAMVLFHIFVLPHLASGPLWGGMMRAASSSCQKNWWTNLLFVQNLVNTHEICMPHSWYLAAEMQLFWISPIILYPLYHRPKLGLAILITFLIASFITPPVVSLLNSFPALAPDSRKTFEEMWFAFCNFYFVTYNRALPFFVGILCGYLVVEKKRVLTRAQTVFNWILASLLLLFCAWNASFVQPGSSVYYPGWEASYVSFGRLGWSLAMAWIIYASTTDSCGPLGRFLSLPIFVPFSRLSFGIYLVSFALQYSCQGAIKTARFYSFFRLAYLIPGDFAVSTILAFILNLCIETPSAILEKMLRNNERPAKID